MDIRVPNPAQYLRQTADLLWKHATEVRREEVEPLLPIAVCFRAANQFDCAVDEWHHSDDIRALPDYERNEHLQRHIPLAIAFRETLEA